VVSNKTVRASAKRASQHPAAERPTVRLISDYLNSCVTTSYPIAVRKPLKTQTSGDFGKPLPRSSFISDYNPQHREEHCNPTVGYRNHPDFPDSENDNFFHIHSIGGDDPPSNVARTDECRNPKSEYRVSPPRNVAAAGIDVRSDSAGNVVGRGWGRGGKFLQVVAW
jgi:hypothetical protein